MSKEVIRKAQLAQLKIMTIIHDVCEKNGIKYYIIGGTALGAVRHNGFIPWDPDIDIAMPRPDYDRFIEKCDRDLQPICSIKTYMNDRNHHAPHALVVLNGSSLVNRFDKFNHETRSIYVDVFPLDVAPSEYKQQVKQANKIKRIKNHIERKRSVIYDHNGYFVRLLKKSVRLAYSVISYQTLCKMLDDEMKKYSYPPPQENYYLCSMASHYSYQKQCMPNTVYGVPRLLKFEGYEFFAPDDVNDYLTRIFKNYMTLPSKEEQEKWYAILDKVEIL